MNAFLAALPWFCGFVAWLIACALVEAFQSRLRASPYAFRRADCSRLRRSAMAGRMARLRLG